MKRIAVIVIGSNSTRLLAADATDHLTTPMRRRVETRLFLGMDASNAFNKEAIEYTAQSVYELKQQADANAAHLIGIFATSASRDASNTIDLADRIKALTGESLRILSGEEEATYAFFGAAGKKKCIAIDIGGGSIELVLGSEMQILAAQSLQLGASRLFKSHPIHNLESSRTAYEHAKLSTNALFSVFKENAPSVPVYLLGGTGTACARMLGKAPEGCILQREQVQNLLHLVSETPRGERKNIPGFPPTRIDILPTGIAILNALLDVLSVEEVHITEHVNADGLLREFVHKNFS